MMTINHDELKQKIAAIFGAAGCQGDEPRCISHHLVEANLVGHDSHGVIRVPTYVKWLGEGKVLANRELRMVSDQETIAIVDGDLGFGQVMGERVMQLAIDKASRYGVGVIGLRNTGHLGRIGDWVTQAVDEGKIAICMVNTSGLGILVAPFGGVERRLSANPIAVGIPVKGRTPIILDISTCAIAEGKIMVAMHKGETVPDECLIDAEGNPTNDPEVFYADVPGAILPFGGHKGFGLGIVVDVLSGALAGGSCSHPGEDCLRQSMLSIVIDPDRFQPQDILTGEIHRFIDFVKSSRTKNAATEILMPGEIEQRTRHYRLEHGIELDKTTWGQLCALGQQLNVSGID